MSASFHQTIGNDFAELKTLMDSATLFLEKQDVDPRAIFRINLSLEEMITNVIKYGSDESGKGSIDIHIEVGAIDVLAEISHDGFEFNPVLHQRKPQPEQVLERETGGLGIYLIKKLLGGMEYRREGGRNIVEIKTPRRLGPSPT